MPLTSDNSTTVASKQITLPVPVTVDADLECLWWVTGKLLRDASASPESSLAQSELLTCICDYVCAYMHVCMWVYVFMYVCVWCRLMLTQSTWDERQGSCCETPLQASSLATPSLNCVYNSSTTYVFPTHSHTPTTRCTRWVLAYLQQLNRWQLTVVTVCDLTACVLWSRSCFDYTHVNVNFLTKSLGIRKGIQPVKTEWCGAGMVICLEWGAKWSSWCCCHPIIACFMKIQYALRFWCRLTQVVLLKRLDGKLRNYTHTHTTHNRFTALWNLSGTTRVSQHQKKHSPTTLIMVINHPYLLSPSTTTHGILRIQSTCSTVFFHNLCPSFLWSTYWPGTLHFILDTFLHPIIVLFSQHMPIPSQPVPL